MSPRAAWRLEQLGFDQVYDYVRGKADWIAAGGPTDRAEDAPPRAGDVLVDVPTCGPDEDPETVLERARAGGWPYAAIVNEAGIVLGRIRKGPRREEGPTTIRLHTYLAEIIPRMEERGVGSILVTTAEGKLLGAVRREDGWAALHAAHEAHDHEHHHDG